VFIEVEAVNVIGVFESPMMVVPLLVMDPAKLIELGAVAVKPPLKVMLPLEALPRVRVPVLRNWVEAVTVLPVPVIDTL
jgi:ribosomal protein L10